MVIIPENRLKEKRLKKLMGSDYYTKPVLRLVLSKLEGVQRVDDLDGGRSVEWDTLETERERKIALVYFHKGVDFVEQMRERGEY